MENIKEGEWYFYADYHLICQVIRIQKLWGETTCLVRILGQKSPAHIPLSKLTPLTYIGLNYVDFIIYITAAARVAEAVNKNIMLAPLSASLIPLPHQIRALMRALSKNRVRFLLADEVGLGKTIEAGLIMRELKIRGLVKRTLVIAPKGLINQWVSEMRTHFGEKFRAVLPEDLKTLKRMGIEPESLVSNSLNNSDGPESNLWHLFDQVVVPMDSFKPLSKRQGWNSFEVEKYNRERFEELIVAGWDLIIVDEAHRLAGATENVARHKLGQGLSEASPHLLLLSATPHQGKTDAFQRLMSLINQEAFPNSESISRDRVRDYVIRTEKRKAIDPEGKPLFKPRITQLIPISWQERHSNQKYLYEALSLYVKEGYNQARREKRNYIGFLMLLMQRLAVSSTSAIRVSLDKRLKALKRPEQLMLFPQISRGDWSDLDGQEQMEALLASQFRAIKNEQEEVEFLLEATEKSELSGPDAKAEALLEWIYRLQAEEGDPELKIIIFTEFIPTQEMLRRFLSQRGFAAVCLNGTMDAEDRLRVQIAFSRDKRILISTDAGGEGLNLQFCHVVINYDIPWNPMRLEQRIGRVDRIGQQHPVRAVNFALKDTVEYRVLDVLQTKLAVILEEFGVDKTGDVLDSAQIGIMFDELYTEAIMNPEKIEESIDRVIKELRKQIEEAKAGTSLLNEPEDLNTKEVEGIRSNPLTFWVERMVTNYIKAYGGITDRKESGWKLIWPDGTSYQNVVFRSQEAEKMPTAQYLTLEEPKIRELTVDLPTWAPEQPIAVLSIPGISKEIEGFWSLWEISIGHYAPGRERPEKGQSGNSFRDENKQRRVMPLFLTDKGRSYLPSAKYIWEKLLTDKPTIVYMMSPEESLKIYNILQPLAEKEGKPYYDELLWEHKKNITREMETAQYWLAARQKAIEILGLPEVRKFRLNRLQQEYEVKVATIKSKESVIPELNCLCIIRIGDGLYINSSSGNEL